MLKKLISTSKNSVLVLSVMICLTLSRLLLRLFDSASAAFELAAILLQLFCFLVPTAVFIMLRFNESMPELHLSMPRLTTTPVVVSSVFMLISGAMLIVLLGGRAGDYTFTPYSSFDAANDYSFGKVLLMIISAALIPAVCEELIFRGVLSSVYAEYGAPTAATLCTLCFALAHMNLYSFPVFIYAGAVLWLLFVATRSIYAPIAVHFFYNLFCLFGLPYINSFYGETVSDGLFIFILTVIFLISTIVFCAGMAFIYKKNADTDTSTVFPHGMRAVDSLRGLASEVLSIAFVLCVIMFFVVAILL